MDSQNQYEPDDVVLSDSGGGSFTKCPEGQDHQGVLCDIIDAGDEWNAQYKKLVPKIYLVWQVECENGERQNDGSRFIVYRKFTKGLSPDGYTRPFLEDWRGQKFTEEEAKAFRLKKLINVNCRLSIMHEESNGKTYANVRGAYKWNTKHGPLIQPENYVRPEFLMKMIAKAQAVAAQAAGANGGTSRTTAAPVTKQDDDDIPF